MGMRMNVAVGYGLKLDNLNKTFISQFENMEDESLFRQFTSDAMRDATKRSDFQDKMAMNFALYPNREEDTNHPITSFYQTVDYDSEFAFDDRLILYPLGYKNQWSRYANLLDNFIWEATGPDDYAAIPEWVDKKGTLYPFIGLMRANPDHPHGVEKFWEPYYLDKPDFKDAVPYAPMHLWHLIKHLKLTQNEEQTTQAFLSLHPVFMRWWS